MAPKMPKAPKEMKSDMMHEVAAMMLEFPTGVEAVEYLLNHFSTFDLIAIRDDLRSRRRQHVRT
jgi:hypothetical protein